MPPHWGPHTLPLLQPWLKCRQHSQPQLWHCRRCSPELQNLLAWYLLYAGPQNLNSTDMKSIHLLHSSRTNSSFWFPGSVKNENIHPSIFAQNFCTSGNMSFPVLTVSKFSSLVDSSSTTCFTFLTFLFSLTQYPITLVSLYLTSPWECCRMYKISRSNPSAAWVRICRIL